MFCWLEIIIITGTSNKIASQPFLQKKTFRVFFLDRKSFQAPAQLIQFFPFLPVFVRYEECALDVTAIWIFPLSIEHFFVVLEIVQIHGTIEC